MLRIDKAILDAEKVISKNISIFDESERGLLSQNILAQLRNLVEYIVQKVFSNGEDTDPNNYDKKKEAWNFVKTKGELKFLVKFHNMLQKSVSHYTFDENSSERLMLKYYEYLLKIKQFLSDKYNMEILSNIEQFPLNVDKTLLDYHKKISDIIEVPSKHAYKNPYNDRAYIQKIKPFFINNKIYYEITFTVANDNISKFDRIIAFTSLDIPDYYSVKFSIHNDIINVMGKAMPIKVIDQWETSIRPCEFNNFFKIFGELRTIQTSSNEYKNVMNFLTSSKINLVDIVTSSNMYYNSIKSKCTKNINEPLIFNCLDECRKLILKNDAGKNIIRYLLLKMNNKVIKNQFCNTQCDKLSKLFLNYRAIPFDEMPFAASLRKHNPKIWDLIECINADNRQLEFLERVLRNNTEQNNILFTPETELSNFKDIDTLISEHNKELYYKHTNRTIKKDNKHYYIKGYTDDVAFIIKKLSQFSTNGFNGYTAFVDSWLQRNQSYIIDSKEKYNSLRLIFEHSCVSLIYGSAGTGKSTFIDHISNLYNDKKKLYLANTHPAVNNLKRKVKASNCKFMTIKKFTKSPNINTNFDILIIDECSTVSNADMKDILEKAKFSLLILVGDNYQIESISFGNWFSIAQKFVPKTSVTELYKPYRTTNNNLLTFWDRVRKLDDSILELMVKNDYTSELNDSLFECNNEDEIILCLNYDGLYGINNMNRFLQSNNKNEEITWGVGTYKVGDPILFNESERFAPLIYNNMKGKIHSINVFNDKIEFGIELDIAITEMEARKYDFKIIGNSSNGNSIISFFVDKYSSTDEDNEYLNDVVPFQVSYAVSIHKAQGLEYKSVKIVITNEVDELITHNIFYTAITRAKEQLKVYWSPETEKKVLEEFKKKDYNRDAFILKNMYKL